MKPIQIRFLDKLKLSNVVLAAPVLILLGAVASIPYNFAKSLDLTKSVASQTSIQIDGNDAVTSYTQDVPGIIKLIPEAPLETENLSATTKINVNTDTEQQPIVVKLDSPINEISISDNSTSTKENNPIQNNSSSTDISISANQTSSGDDETGISRSSTNLNIRNFSNQSQNITINSEEVTTSSNN
jgi:hypothetical protein